MKFALSLFRPLRSVSPEPRASDLGPQDREGGPTSFAFSLFRPHAKSVDLAEQRELRPSPTMLAYMRGEPTCPKATPKTFGFSVFKRDHTPARVLAPKRPLPSFAFSLFSPPGQLARGPRPETGGPKPE